MSNGKTILVLGGGIGGVATATLLRKKLSRAHRVVLIEREERHLFQPSLVWLMVGGRDAQSISRPMSALDRTGIERIQGTVESIDPQQRTVRVNGQTLNGDIIVIALGAHYAPESIPGLAESGHNFYSLDGAERLRDARLQVKSGCAIVLVSGIPFKCPAAPYEAAMLLRDDFNKRGLSSVEVHVYTPEPGPMSTAGPDVSKKMRGLIESLGIIYHPEHAIKSVDGATKKLSFANGTDAAYDLLAYVPPHRAPAVVRDAGLCGDSGWVPVNRDTLETKFPDVYAIGDVTGIPLKMGKPLPKAGVFAHRAAHVVANNIALALTGAGTPDKFSGDGACFVETGHGRAGYGNGDFFAEPVPQMKFSPPSMLQHWGKVAFEKYWLWKWF